jgi:hypothetical protein
VIRLAKSELVDFARVTVLANTPLSLFNGMVNCAGMAKLRRCSTEDLMAYYDRVTARAGRSEIVVGVAYAVLCAIALHAREAANINVDASRLQWGERIWEFMKRANVRTSRFDIDTTPQRPIVTSVSSVSSDTRVSLYGADGNAVAWRNR